MNPSKHSLTVLGQVFKLISAAALRRLQGPSWGVGAVDGGNSDGLDGAAPGCGFGFPIFGTGQRTSIKRVRLLRCGHCDQSPA